MTSSLKAVLRKKANQDGTFPLAIRVTVDRKSSYIYLGQHLKTSDVYTYVTIPHKIDIAAGCYSITPKISACRADVVSNKSKTSIFCPR